MITLRRVKTIKAGAGTWALAWLLLGLNTANADESSHLQLAPIKFSSQLGGVADYTWQSNAIDSNLFEQQLLHMGVVYSARAQSFFWQPWFSRIAVNAMVAADKSTTNGNTSAYGNSGKLSLKGDAHLQILPQSRVPFEANAYRLTMQTYGNSGGPSGSYYGDYLTTGYNFSQGYNTRNKSLVSSLIYSHNESGRIDIGPEVIDDGYGLSLTGQPKGSRQSYRVNASVNKRDLPVSGVTSSYDTIVANHNWQPTSAATVSSMLNLLRSAYTLPATPVAPSKDWATNSQQFSSLASWRPEASPLTVTSSVRLFRSKVDTDGYTLSKLENSNFNLGANYAWSKLLRIYGYVNAYDDNLTGIQTITTSANLAARKLFGDQLDTVDVGGFRYSRYISATLSNQSTTVNTSAQSKTTSSQSMGGSVGHDLRKSSKLGKGNLAVDFNQALSSVISTVETPSTRLISNGSIGWVGLHGKGTTTMRLNAMDSRLLSKTQSYFQIINFQASRRESLAVFESMTGNLTLQSSRSGDNTTSSPFVTTPSADIGYQNQRLFKIRNLTFDSNFKVIGAQISSSQAPASEQGLSVLNQPTYMWDNNVYYSIGRTTAKLLTRLSEVNSTKQRMLFFNITRQF